MLPRFPLLPLLLCRMTTCNGCSVLSSLPRHSPTHPRIPPLPLMLRRMATRMSFEFVAVCPKGYEPDPDTLAYAQV